MKQFYSLTQLGLLDCGPTALKMLLAYLYQDERFLFIQETWDRPSSFKNLLEFANHFGVTLKGYKLHHPSSVRGIKKPFIALMKQPQSHYITVVPKGGSFHILDPKGSYQKVKDPFFKDGFSGYILMVKHLAPHVRPDLPMNQLWMNRFWLGSYLLFTLIIIIWFWQPIDWIFMAGLMIGFMITWLGFVYRQVKHIDQVMIKYYLTLIHNANQFKLFHQWKQGWFGLPLNQLYRWLVLTGTVIYTLFASPTYLVVLGIYHAIVALAIRHKYLVSDHEVQAIGKLEQSLKYPFIPIKDFQQLMDKVYQLVRFRFGWSIVMMITAIMMVWIYQQFYKFEAFITWFTMVSILMINYSYHQQLFRYPQEKKEWRQLGFMFLNSKDYVKI